MKIEKLIPGQIVYDVHSHRMGNTTMRTMGCWEVRIVSIDLEKGTVVATWNSNPAQTFYRNSIQKWREKKPVFVSTGAFGKRIATRAELKATEASK